MRSVEGAEKALFQPRRRLELSTAERELRNLRNCLSPGLSGFNEIDRERDFQNLNRPGNKPVFQIWKAGANIYVVWTERGDGAVLVNRIWVDASSGGAGGDDTTCSSKNKSLNAVSPPASSVRELQAEVRALNRQLHEKSQNAAEHKKHLNELRKKNLELKNDLTIPEAVLASRLPGPE